MPGNKWLHEDDLEELIEDAVAEEKCRGEKKVTEKGTKKEDGFVWGGGF